MESLDYWRLCDELSVIQAIFLILDDDPADNQYSAHDSRFRPKGYEAAYAALTNAINSGNLPAIVRNDFNGDTCWHGTTINVDDLKKWLVARGFKPEFFFPNNAAETPDYLSDQNPHYAPKLAAALSAWLHVTQNPKVLNGKTPKQAIEKWLREHALSYGLTKDDGSPNEQGIAEIAKVANWKPTGGAAKTPTANSSAN